jgi:hypothetical protein
MKLQDCFPSVSGNWWRGQLLIERSHLGRTCTIQQVRQVYHHCIPILFSLVAPRTNFRWTHHSEYNMEMDISAQVRIPSLSYMVSLFYALTTY